MLPPDMREWLAPDHLVWFVISVVEELDLALFEVRSRLGGAGRAGFDPRMLLTVLVYAYAVGERSSRQIERLCHTDVAFIIACAQDPPDHTTIARFRKDHQDALKAVFTQVLALCAKSGLARLGAVAIDGTKIAANASHDAQRGQKWLREQVEKMVAEATATDAAEDALFGAARGDELPAELVNPATRKERIKTALADLDADAAEKGPGFDRVAAATRALDAARARAQKSWDAYERRVEAAGGRRPRGRLGVPVEDNAHVRQAREVLERAKARLAEKDSPTAGGRKPAKAQRNITDPDSRILPTRNKGWVVGYNAQLAVSQDQIIIAADAVASPADSLSFIPMLRAVEQAADLLRSFGSTEEVGVVLADAGYRSIENITAPGPDRLIATGKRHDDERRARDEPAVGPPPGDATPLEAMAHRVRTPEGHKLYARRSPMVEGVNGQLKDVIGLRRFSRRGLRAVNSELHFAAAVHNLLKIFRNQLQTA